MAPSLKVLATFFLAFTIWSSTSTIARPTLDDFRHSEVKTLMTRLNLDDNSTGCWESLFKLQACTGEVIQFFYNGETYMGPDCCQAVLVIVKDCWSTMLSSLGFTSEEVDLLRVFCDAQANGSGPKSLRSSDGGVQPIDATAGKIN